MMNKEKQMETIMPQDSKQEAAEVMDFLGTLDHGEKKEMLAFLRGVQFGKRLGVDATRVMAG